MRRLSPNVVEQHLRQLDIYNPERHDPEVVVIGAGGIGSWTVYQLSKLGVRRLRVIDHDHVVTHNLSTTPYRPEDIGYPKVQALARVVAAKGYRGVARKFTGRLPAKADIVISAVDSMATRKLLFDAATKHRIPFFIDGRIGGEDIRVYAVRPTVASDRALYASTLKSDGQVPVLPCTAQNVIDVGWTTASLITRALRQWVAQRRYTPEVVLNQAELELFVSPTKSGVPESRRRRKHR